MKRPTRNQRRNSGILYLLRHNIPETRTALYVVNKIEVCYRQRLSARYDCASKQARRQKLGCRNMSRDNKAVAFSNATTTTSQCVGEVLGPGKNHAPCKFECSCFLPTVLKRLRFHEPLTNDSLGNKKTQVNSFQTYITPV